MCWRYILHPPRRLHPSIRLPPAHGWRERGLRGRRQGTDWFSISSGLWGFEVSYEAMRPNHRRREVSPSSPKWRTKFNAEADGKRRGHAPPPGSHDPWIESMAFSGSGGRGDVGEAEVLVAAAVPLVTAMPTAVWRTSRSSGRAELGPRGAVGRIVGRGALPARLRRTQ